MEDNKTSNIIEHKYLVLDTKEKNRNYRTYGTTITDKWLEHEDLKSGRGIDIEFAINDDADIENEYLQERLSCGRISALNYEGSKLYATVKFKDNELTKELYSGNIKPENLAVIPKGKGSVKNQQVQEDYELFGFNLVKLDESSFVESTKEVEAVNE